MYTTWFAARAFRAFPPDSLRYAIKYSQIFLFRLDSGVHFKELTETEIGLTKKSLLEESYELVMQHLKQHKLFFAPTVETDQLKAIVESFKAQIHAKNHYQAQSCIHAPIVLFRHASIAARLFPPITQVSPDMRKFHRLSIL